jgi:hypothetical protein
MFSKAGLCQKTLKPIIDGPPTSTRYVLLFSRVKPYNTRKYRQIELCGGTFPPSENKMGEKYEKFV